VDVTEKEIIRDPKYAPPYPQDFYRFWPRHAVKSAVAIVATLALIVTLSVYFVVPTDINMPPLPDEGIYVPAPEWYLFFLFQPFWYLINELSPMLRLGTFWAPFAVGVLLLATPFLLGRKKASATPMAVKGKIVAAVIAVAIWGAGIAGVVGSGYPAKTTGCMSCHNAMMGVRQALPPADIGKFYREARQRQIQVGKYRIGSTTGVGMSYKDANWQLRHFYEPTMTW